MVDRDPVRVGILFSHTGVTSTIGLSQLHGALLAIDEINEAGGINGRELVPVQYDAQSNPQRYAQLAEQLPPQREPRPVQQDPPTPSSRTFRDPSNPV